MARKAAKAPMRAYKGIRLKATLSPPRHALSKFANSWTSGATKSVSCAATLGKVCHECSATWGKEYTSPEPHTLSHAVMTRSFLFQTLGTAKH